MDEKQECLHTCMLKGKITGHKVQDEFIKTPFLDRENQQEKEWEIRNTNLKFSFWFAMKNTK